MENYITELELKNIQLTSYVKNVSKIRDLFKVIPFSNYKNSSINKYLPENDIVSLNVDVIRINSEPRPAYFKEHNIPNVEYLIEDGEYEDHKFYDFSLLKKKIDKILDFKIDDQEITRMLTQKNSMIMELEIKNRLALDQSTSVLQAEFRETKNKLKEIESMYKNLNDETLETFQSELSRLNNENMSLKTLLSRKDEEIAKLKSQIISFNEIQKLSLEDKIEHSEAR